MVWSLPSDSYKTSVTQLLDVMAELKVAHVKRVKSLYKRACRLIEAWYDRRDVIRYEITLMRNRFDRNATLSRRAGHLLYCEGEDELFKKSHWHLRKFPESPGELTVRFKIKLTASFQVVPPTRESPCYPTG